MSSELTALRLGFEAGLYSRDHVGAWVDREVAARDQLPSELLELATMAHKRDEEVVALLRSLECEVPEAELARLKVAVIAELYRRGKLDLAGTVYALEGVLTWTPSVAEEDRSVIHDIVLHNDAAEFSGYGSVDDVRTKIREFLARRHWNGLEKVDGVFV